MDFEKLTQHQVKSILIEAKKKANRSKDIDVKSLVLDIKHRILSVITAPSD